MKTLEEAGLSSDANLQGYWKLTDSTYDSYTKLRVNFNGADGATTLVATTGQTLTFSADAQLDTAQKKFGTASLLLDGTGDKVTVPDSEDWNLGSGDFTIDYWVRYNATPSGYDIVQQYDDGNNRWGIGYNSSKLYALYVVSGGVVKAEYTMSYTPTTGVWIHHALVRSGTTIYFFVNGVSQSLTVATAVGSNALPSLSSALEIGGCVADGYFNGWIDELRISKGIARWTANFTPPTEAYTHDSLADSSANAYNLKAINYPLNTGETGGYLKDFESSDSLYATNDSVANLRKSGSQTLVCRFRPESSGANQRLCGVSDSATTNHFGLIYDSAKKFGVEISSLSPVSKLTTTTYDPGTTYLVVGRYEEKQVSLYFWGGTTFTQNVLKYNADYQKLSLKFTVGSSNISVPTVTLRLKKTGTPTGTMTLEIQTDSSGNPSGTVVTNGSVTKAESAVGTSYEEHDFTFATAPALTASTSYHLVLNSDRADSTSNYISWAQQDGWSGYTEGTAHRKDGSTWYDVGGPFSFKLYRLGTLAIFVDGVKLSTDVTGNHTAGSGAFSIGRLGAYDSTYADGIMSYVAFFDRALTDAEILGLSGASVSAGVQSLTATLYSPTVTGKALVTLGTPSNLTATLYAPNIYIWTDTKTTDVSLTAGRTYIFKAIINSIGSFDLGVKMKTKAGISNGLEEYISIVAGQNVIEREFIASTSGGSYLELNFNNTDSFAIASLELFDLAKIKGNYRVMRIQGYLQDGGFTQKIWLKKE